MTLDEYTPDAICRAMGLPGFVEAAWAKQKEPVMRVLLEPSFHPEVCITIDSRALVASVVTFDKTSFWHSGPGQLLTTWREEVSIERQACLDLLRLFRETNEGLDKSKSYVCVDGMGIDACLSSSVETHGFTGNVGGNRAMHAFARSLLETVQIRCSRLEVCYGISAALYYVGGESPKAKDNPDSLPIVRVAVIGEAEERSELLKAIEKKTGGAFGKRKR